MTRRFDFSSLTVFFAIALIPVYVFPSGGLQPSHFLFSLLAIYSIFRYGIPNDTWSIAFAATALYVTFVECVYAAVRSDIKSVVNGLYFIFNYILVLGVYHIFKIKSLKIVTYGIFAAGIVVGSVIVVGGVNLTELEGGRETATFNNPNQLGFFSVCYLSFAYLLYRNKAIRYLYLVILLAASLFFAIISLSKAAIIANLLVALFALKPRGRRGMTVWITIALLLAVGAYFASDASILERYLAYQRIYGASSESDSSLEARGYLAFIEASPSQILFGLGYAGAKEIIGHEVHSTLGSMFNNYGLVGVTLFVTLLYLWFRAVWLAWGSFGLLCISGPSMLYGLTHNGTRFTFFWLLVGVSLGVVRRQFAASQRLQQTP